MSVEQQVGTRLAIINPASASGRTASRWQGIIDDLRGRGVEIDPVVTKGPGDAIAATRDFLVNGGREVVLLGGDGTVNEVGAGCLDEDGTAPVADGIILSVIHQGTGGDFARGLGIPKDPTGAVTTAVDGTPRPVDLGVASFVDDRGDEQVRGWLSACNVGMGAAVVARVNSKYKRLGDTAGFALGTIVTLIGNRPRKVRLSLDGVVPQSAQITDIIAASNRYMGGGMFVAPDAEMDDGLIDVVTVRAAGALTLLRAFPKIYKGTHVGHPIVDVERASRLYVGVEQGAAPQGVVLDGELVGHTPAQFRLLKQAISVRVPSTP